MPFRLAKCSFRTCASAVALLGLVLVAQVASATMTVTSENFGSMATGNLTIPTIYYGTVPPGTTGIGGSPLLFYDYGFGQVSPGSVFCNDNPNTMGNGLAIQVQSLAAISPPANQLAFVALQLKQQGTYTAPIFLPIAGYAVQLGGPNTVCNIPAGSIPPFTSTQCSYLGVTMPAYSNPSGPGCSPSDVWSRYFVGVNYSSGELVNLLVYPGDMCAALTAEGAVLPNGACSGAAVNPTSANPVQLTFRAIVVYAPNDFASGPSGGFASTVDASGDTGMSFQSDVSAELCPGPPDASSAIFPGDTQIQVNSTSFGIQQVSTNDAPGTEIVVVAQQSPGVPANVGVEPAPVYAPPANVVGTGISMNGTSQYVAGFQDSPSAPNTAGAIGYNMDFFIRDATGMVVGAAPSPAPALNCAATGFAYKIDGFLNSSRCFIATAAFRDMNVAPVVMLREFRDRILLHHSWGRNFVREYYRWSPAAAVWLVWNPSFRFPVLLLLIPIEAVAWLALHPGLAVLLLPFGLLLLVTTRHATRPRKRAR